MFDNGSLLRRRKRFKTAAAKARQLQAEQQHLTNNQDPNELNKEPTEAYNYSDYDEGELLSSDDEETSTQEKESEAQSDDSVATKHLLLGHQQMSPHELNQMFLMSNNFKSNNLTNADPANNPIMVNIPSEPSMGLSLSMLSSNSESSSIVTKKQLAPQHASSPKPKNSFSIDSIIGDDSLKQHAAKSSFSKLNQHSQMIKRQSKKGNKKLAQQKNSSEVSSQLCLENQSSPLSSKRKQEVSPDDERSNQTNKKQKTQQMYTASRSTSISSSRLESHSSNSSGSRCCSPEPADQLSEQANKHFKTSHPMLNIFHQQQAFSAFPHNVKSQLSNDHLAAMRLRNSLSFLYASPVLNNSINTNTGLPLDCSPTSSSSLSTTPSSLSSSSSTSSSFSGDVTNNNLPKLQGFTMEQQLEMHQTSPVPYQNKNMNWQNQVNQQHIYKMFNDAMLMRAAVAAAASSQFNSNMHSYLASSANGNLLISGNNNVSASSLSNSGSINSSQNSAHNNISNTGNTNPNISNILPFFLPMHG